MAVSKQQKIKCVAVGDTCTGKTLLLKTYIWRMFREENDPTVFDYFETTADVDGVSVTLTLVDTSGMEGYERIRHLAYPQTDVFLIVFSLAHPVSLVNISNNWYPEVCHSIRNAPIVLVGTKADLMSDPDQLRGMQSRRRDVPVTREQAEEMREKIGASAYVECSARTMEGVDDVFNEAIRTVWKANEHKEQSEMSKKSTGCQIA